MKNTLELVAFQGAEDCLPRNLLPPRAGLFITHDEVLIIYARQVKVEDAAVYSCFPHQTGVTERSISGHQGRATDGVLHHMVVSHQPDWISNRLSLILDRYHHIGIANKSSFTCLNVLRAC